MTSGDQNFEAGTKKDMATWELARRLRRIQRIFVKHNNAVAAREALDDGFENGIRLRESSPTYLAGDSRCGKSELIKRFIAAKSGAPFPAHPSSCVLVKGPACNVVYLDCHNGATPLQACSEMLQELFEFRATASMKQSEASGLLIKLFRRDEIGFLVIDEAQKMISGRSPKDLVNWIISLRNAGFFRILVAGDATLAALVNADKVLRDSKKALVELLPFSFKEKGEKTEFKAFLDGFEKDMPFLRTPLADPAFTEAFFFATRGRPGTLAILLETATASAFKRTALPETLEPGDLSKAFDQQMGGELRMRGINPFTHKGELPGYARTPEEEETELQRVFIDRQTKGRQRARQLDTSQ